MDGPSGAESGRDDASSSTTGDTQSVPTTNSSGEIPSGSTTSATATGVVSATVGMTDGSSGHDETSGDPSGTTGTGSFGSDGSSDSSSSGTGMATTTEELSCGLGEIGCDCGLHGCVVGTCQPSGDCVELVGDMVTVPAGTFTMGCDDAVDPNCTAEELPLHDVLVADFQIDRLEVTVASYLECVDAAACVPPGMGTCPAGQPNPGQLAVGCVTQPSAELYCAWMGKRLPTEAEWEKAARGAEARVYPWGNAAPTCTLANASVAGCPGMMQNVGSHPAGASIYGALDMAGNAAEWVSDWYDAGYYAASDPADPQGPATGTEKIFRGGSWVSSPIYLRTSDRSSLPLANSGGAIGFRCAASL